VVLPEQDAVLAVTAGTGDMQAVLNAAWDHLLPAMRPGPLSEDPATHEALRRTLAGLTVRPPAGAPSSPMAATMSGTAYRFEDNELGIEAAALEFGADGSTVLRVRDDARGGEHEIACGGGGAWTKGATIFGVAPSLGGASATAAPTPVAASGAWAADDTYVAKLCFYETPFCPTITCRFAEGDRLLLDYRENVSFGPTEHPQLVGQAEKRKFGDR
jgi:hypothetical protein